MRGLIDHIHRMRRAAMRIVRWRTRGVKAMVLDREGRLLMVRHRYGNSALWMLPGGGIARRETPAAAAIREVEEEVGCRIERVQPLGVFESRTEGRRDTVHLFSAVTADAAIPDGVEIEAAAFFALDQLPETTSPATRRRIAEMIGQRAPTGEW